jgi:membrane-associated PAP2 superfamily phosphatase
MQLTALILGTRQTIAGTVYGTIVVLSVVTAASTVEHDLWRLAVIAAATVAVYWIAHVYSDGLGESLNVGRRLTAAELGMIARRERSILLAAVLPVSAIVLGALGVLANRTALWVAVGIGVATLTVQGLRYARLERLSRTGTIVTAAINLALGLLIVALKALVAH